MIRISMPATAALSCLAFSLLAGCSSKEDATKENFVAAIDPLVKDAYCRKLPSSTLRLGPPTEKRPVYPIVLFAQEEKNYLSPREHGMLEGLTQEGFMKKVVKHVPAARAYSEEPLTPTDVLIFTPTQKAREILRSKTGRTDNGAPVALPAACFGEGHVTEITNFTAPADAFGMKMTTVSYQYEAENVPDETPAEIRSELEKPRKGKKVLVLTDKGWVSAEEMGRR